jgi:hypothetical protein
MNAALAALSESDLYIADGGWSRVVKGESYFDAPRASMRPKEKILMRDHVYGFSAIQKELQRRVVDVRLHRSNRWHWP